MYKYVNNVSSTNKKNREKVYIFLQNRMIMQFFSVIMYYFYEKIIIIELMLNI